MKAEFSECQFWLRGVGLDGGDVIATADVNGVELFDASRKPDDRRHSLPWWAILMMAGWVEEPDEDEREDGVRDLSGANEVPEGKGGSDAT